MFDGRARLSKHMANDMVFYIHTLKLKRALYSIEARFHHEIKKKLIAAISFFLAKIVSLTILLLLILKIKFRIMR